MNAKLNAQGVSRALAHSARKCIFPYMATDFLSREFHLETFFNMSGFPITEIIRSVRRDL